MTQRLSIWLLTVILATQATAHHVVDFVVTSDTEGGGQLLIDYRFESIVPVTFNFSIDGTSVFSGTNPGFDTADGDEFFPGTNIPYPIFPPGIPITVELVDNDGGRTGMKLNDATLAAPGDTAPLGVSGAIPPGDVHRHPEWLLFAPVGEGVFAEGRITFRVTTTTPGYAPSRAYTLVLSNGNLPAPDFGADGVDRATIGCQQAAGAATDAYSRVVWGALRRCLDRAQVVRAYDTAGVSAVKAERAMDRVCTGGEAGGPDAATLLGKVARARQRAIETIRRRCGAAGSGDFPDAIITQHLGKASCLAEQAVAATYFRAKLYLRRLVVHESQGGATLATHFPCVFQTSGEEEGPS